MPVLTAVPAIAALAIAPIVASPAHARSAGDKATPALTYVNCAPEVDGLTVPGGKVNFRVCVKFELDGQVALGLVQTESAGGCPQILDLFIRLTNLSTTPGTNADADTTVDACHNSGWQDSVGDPLPMPYQYTYETLAVFENVSHTGYLSGPQTPPPIACGGCTPGD